MDKFTEPQLCAISAYFARSNMGMVPVDAQRLGSLMYPKLTLDSAVEALCGEFMETDDHFDAFMEEAEGWYSEFKGQGLDDIMKSWPEHGLTIQKAMELSKAVT